MRALGARRPVKVLLVAFTLVAIVGLVVLSLLNRLLDGLGESPDPKDVYGYGVYLDIATLWALAFGVLGICSVALRPWRHRPTAVRDLALCDLALVLAVLWPLQLAVAAVVFASRSHRSRLRWATVAIGVAFFLGGTTWGAVAYEKGHPWTANGGNVHPLLGNWHDSEGGRLSLLPSGEYIAEADPSDGLWPWDAQRITGHWTLTTSPRGGTAVSLEGGTIQFDAYGALSPSRLCLEYGLEQPCDLALHR
jgi:hypothetical protein